MNDRIMVKMTSSDDWVIFKTVTRAWKSSSLFYSEGGLIMKVNHLLLQNRNTMPKEAVVPKCGTEAFLRSTKYSHLFYEVLCSGSLYHTRSG